MEASRFKLRFRTLPEKRAASKTALMITETAALMISKVLYHDIYFKAQGNNGSRFKKGIIAFDRVKWQ